MNNNRLLKGILLGSAVLGAGIYVSKNKELKDQLSTKVKDGLNSLNQEGSSVQEKVKAFVDSTKTTVNKSINDTKISLNDSVDKTTKQINDVVSRLSDAFIAGKTAANQSLKNSLNQPVEKTFDLKDTPAIRANKEMNLGAVEDTTVDNSSVLHPVSNNIAPTVDATTKFDAVSSVSLPNSNDEKI